MRARTGLHDSLITRNIFLVTINCSALDTC